MYSSMKLLLLLCIVVWGSGCKVGAFYAGAGELEDCKGQVSTILASVGFKTAIEDRGYSLSQLNAQVLEIKSSTKDEFWAKVVVQNDKQILQVIGIDLLPQECGYDRDCPISEKSRQKMLDLISSISETLHCNVGETTFKDIKKLESSKKKIAKWKEDPLYLID